MASSFKLKEIGLGNIEKEVCDGVSCQSRLSSVMLAPDTTFTNSQAAKGRRTLPLYSPTHV